MGQYRFFLAVTGLLWVNARLQHPGDFVRLEIEAALRRGIPLVPVLVDWAAMPKPEELPESLRSLVYLNATSLRPGRHFSADIEQLVKGLHRAEEWKQRKNGEADWEPVGWELSLPEGINLENDEPRPDWEPVEWQPSEDS